MAIKRIKTSLPAKKAGAASSSRSVTRGGAEKKTTARKQPAGPARGLAALRDEVKTLKKLVLLQKVKRDLLQREKIGSAEIDALLADYLRVILNLTGTVAGSILIHEDDRLVFRASSGPGARQLIGRQLPLDEGIAGWVFKSGKTYLSSDVSRDTRWSSKISAELHFPTHNILASPLRIGDKMTGVVEIINKSGDRPFGKDDKEMLETLASQLALDVAYASLLSASRREADRRAMQMQLSLVLNSTLDQREVRKRAMEAATSLLDAEVGSLLLVDEKTRDLFFEVALGAKGEHLKQIRLKMGEGLAGWVAANDQAALVNDVQNDPRHFKMASSITHFVTRNMICVPVRSKGRVVGVLQAINKKGGGLFTAEDLENFWSLSNQVAIALDNARLYEEIHETFLSTAEALAAAVEKKDPYTGGHIVRVLKYSTAIAKHLPRALSDLEVLKLAAVLHDIGKIGIKDHVLLKEGKLDPQELAHMREHPLVGDDILAHIENMKGVRRVMRAHHEQWDGSGYPDQLAGEEIPVHSRIIAIADAFDALTTDRPYRKAADLDAAMQEIKKSAGKSFDPALVEVFLKACEAGSITILR